MSASIARIVVPALLVVALGLGASAQESHKDERIGFKLRVPRGWQQIPLRTDEAWIVGRYRAPKPDTTVDPTSGNTLEHNAELRIIAFLENASPEADEEPSGDDEEKEPAKVYRDYEEYMRETYPHGFFVEKEEAGTHEGLAVRRLEIKVERQIDVAEKRIVTWIYATEIAAVAVQLEIQSEAAKKHRAAIEDVLRSFQVIPRTQALEAGAAGGGFLSSVELAKLTPAERKQRKIEAQRKEWERMKRDLPTGWTALEIEGVCVLNHVDERYAKKVVEQIKAILAWLNTNFPEVGPNEYARAPLVRICKDQDEESAFRRGSGTYWVYGTDLVTHKGTRSESWEWEYISGRTLQIWFEEREPELWAALPRWLAAGMDEVVSSAKLQGGKLAFEMGDQEKFTREELPHGDEDSMAVRTLLTLSAEEFDAFGKRDDWKTWCQAVALTRYFIAARTKGTRELLASYLANLRLVLADLEGQDEQDQKAAKPPANEAEEEALFQQRTEWLKSRERLLLESTLEKTFSGWSPGDWKGFERGFRRSL